MGAARMLRQWNSSVNRLLGSLLSRHLVKSLSSFSIAMCAAGHCHSGRLAAAAVSDAKPASTRRRWERLLANDYLDAEDSIHVLARSVLEHWSGRPLLLVLDETPNGEALRCLRLGVAYRKRLLSIAAACYRTDQPPVPMPELIGRLLRKAATVLPRQTRVTFLCDRGLAWPAVMDCVRQLGWDHVLRLQHTTRVTLPDQRTLQAGELVRHKDQRWHGPAMIFKKAGWRNAHVTALWDRRAKEPWILAAREDGPGGIAAARAYAKRNWCEQTFRDEKSSGFHWDESHVTDPTRALRVVLVMVLANLLSISLGTWLIKTARRKDLDPHPVRRLSIFQLGTRWLRHMLLSLQEAIFPPRLPYLYPK